MNTLAKRICAISASAAMATAMVLPASAASMETSVTQPRAHVEFVRWHHHRRHHERIIIRGGHHYYRGHRGYRHYHHGYRHYNGYWFPPAAFVAGAIVGGALSSGGASAHVRWCESHYRSYDPASDTFQPYHGPRERCVSP